MNITLFPEFVEKYFQRVVGKIVEKYNDLANKPTMMHKTMLTEEYSADLKWGATEINHSVVSADIVAIDSPLPLKKRDTISHASGDLPKLGVKMQKGEKLITDINVIKARSNNEAVIVSKIFDDVAKCIDMVDVLKERMFRTALSTGQMLVGEDTNDGTGVRVSFGYKEENIFHCLGTAWTGANPTPQDDIQQLFTKAADDGNTIAHVYLTRRYFDAFRKSQQGRILAANTSQLLVTDATLLPVPGRTAFIEALADEFGAQFHVVEGSFKAQGHDGKNKDVEAWKEANIVATPSNVVGRLVYGTLAEETMPVSNVNYQKAGSHVLISKYSKNDPLTEFTSAQAICMPVIDNAGSIYLLHADATTTDEAHKTADAKVETRKKN